MLATCSFGSANTGATVAYKLTGGTYSTSGVSELESGSGIYGVTVADADIAGKTIYWRLGSGAPYKYAAESFPVGLAKVPAEAGAAMTLTSEYNAAKTAAAQSTLDSLAISVSTVGVTTNSIKTKTDQLTFTETNKVDATATVSTTGLATSASLAAVKSETAAIKTKTDSLTFTTPNKVDASATVDTTGIATSASLAAVKTDTANIYSKVDTEVALLATSASLAAVKTVVDAIDISTLATSASLAAIASDTSLSRKILTNKTVDTATKVTVYDDDNVSVAGSYTWTEASGTRSKLS